jgi:uncharacterized protein (TIGR02117 family)
MLTLLGLVVAILFYLGAAFCLSRTSVNDDVQSEEQVTIYILTNGVHTDIVVPVKTSQIDWSGYIKPENTKANDHSAEFLALGWGDKGFYLETPTWADLKASTAFKASFGLSSSAMHTTFYKRLKEGDDCKSIQISYKDYEGLIAFIKQSMKLDQNGMPILIDTNANYGKNDAFYEAKGSYSLFKTCNTWTNNSLKSCGQRAALWTAFDTGIFYHYQ